MKKIKSVVTVFIALSMLAMGLVSNVQAEEKIDENKIINAQTIESILRDGLEEGVYELTEDVQLSDDQEIEFANTATHVTIHLNDHVIAGNTKRIFKIKENQKLTVTATTGGVKNTLHGSEVTADYFSSVFAVKGGSLEIDGGHYYADIIISAVESNTFKVNNSIFSGGFRPIYLSGGASLSVSNTKLYNPKLSDTEIRDFPPIGMYIVDVETVAISNVSYDEVPGYTIIENISSLNISNSEFLNTVGIGEVKEATIDKTTIGNRLFWKGLEIWNSNVTINSGNFIGGDDFESMGSAIVARKSKVIVNGGNFTGTGGLAAEDNSEIIINDGNFIADMAAMIFDSKAIINDGNFTARKMALMLYKPSLGSQLNGGVYTVDENAGSGALEGEIGGISKSPMILIDVESAQKEFNDLLPDGYYYDPYEIESKVIDAPEGVFEEDNIKITLNYFTNDQVTIRRKAVVTDPILPTIPINPGKDVIVTTQDNINKEILDVIESVEKGKAIDPSILSEETYLKIQAAIHQGFSINAALATTILDEKMKLPEMQWIVDAVNKFALKNNTNVKVAQYFDLSVMLQANNENLGMLHAFNKKAMFKVSLPKAIQKKGRKYYVARVHNGEIEILDAKINTDGTVSFESDKFSTYALLYEDPIGVNTNDTSHKNIFLFLLLGSGFLLSWKAKEYLNLKK